jgi:hypothetical protein
MEDADNVYDLAQRLLKHDTVDDVQVSHRRIVVVYAPDERGVETVPQSFIDHVHNIVDDTLWEPEYDWGVDAERHSWSSGIHSNPVLGSHKQPAGYELQFPLVK